MSHLNPAVGNLPWCRTLIVALTLLAGGLPGRAAASYLEAVEAYAAGDHAAARGAFEETARIGHLSSQFNLAVMLLQGQGGPADPVKARAWMEVAASGGDPRAQGALGGAALKDVVSPPQMISDWRDRFGAQANALRLHRSGSASRTPRKWIRAVKAVFPQKGAIGALPQGWLLSEYAVSATGQPYDVRTGVGVNKRWFEAATHRGLQRSQLTSDGEGRSYRAYTIQAFGVKDETGYSIDLASLKSTCDAAESGVPSQQMLCGALLLGESRTSSKPEDRDRDRARGRLMFLRAAMGGEPEAAMFASLLAAWPGDAAAVREERLWLEIAAHGGLVSAQLRLVERYLAGGTPTENQWRRMERWVTDANPTDGYELKHLIRILLDPATPRLSNLDRAFSLVPALESRAEHDPQARELQAYALARQGKHREAVARQADAIRQAADYAWNTEAMERRRQDYLARRVPDRPPYEVPVLGVIPPRKPDELHPL